MKASDTYTGQAQFTDMLERAEENANNAWETEFLENIRSKFEQYGMDMFLSEAQDETLRKIAGRD